MIRLEFKNLVMFVDNQDKLEQIMAKCLAIKGVKAPVTLSYIDEEGDLTSIVTDKDLEAALMTPRSFEEQLTITVSVEDDSVSSSSDSEFEMVDYEGVAPSETSSVVVALPPVVTALKQEAEDEQQTITSEMSSEHPAPPSEVGEETDRGPAEEEEEIYHDTLLAQSAHLAQASSVQQTDSVAETTRVEDFEPPVGVVVSALEVVGDVVPPQAAASPEEVSPPRLNEHQERVDKIRLDILTLISKRHVVEALASATASQSVQRAVTLSAQAQLETGRDFVQTLFVNHGMAIFPAFAQLAATAPELIESIPRLMSDVLALSTAVPVTPPVVVPVTPPSIVPPPPVVSEPVVSRTMHVNVRCDGCMSDDDLRVQSLKGGFRHEETGVIMGARYKSTTKSDYDLCEVCEASERFESFGPFIKYRTPKQNVCVVLPSITAQVPPSVVISASTPTTSEPNCVISNPVHAPRPPPPPPPATSDVNQPHCPQKHALKRFVAPHAQFKCNMCDRRVPAGSILHGCRVCDYDQCHSCTGLGSIKGPVVVSQGPPQAKFLADVTLHDGAVVEGGSTYVKTWRVKNSSPNIAWPHGVRIVNIGGPSMGCPVEGFSVDCDAARPGAVLDVSVSLKMPTEPGKYTSFFRLITGPPTHQRFGHRFWVSVNVKEKPVTRQAAPWNANTELAVSQIVEMGFSDVDEILRVLQANEGKINETVDQLFREKP